MKFATYNMMFGMYGKIGICNFLGHFAFHGIKSVFLTKLLSRFNTKTSEFIGKTNADIVCLNEVLGTLRKDKLIEDLKKQDFKYFCWGPAIHHSPPLDIGTLLASKYKFEKIKFNINQESRMGGGAGACAVYIKKRNICVLGLHLGIRKNLLQKQIKKISEFIKIQKKKKRKIILMGDFNLDEKELKGYKEFRELDLIAANKERTCPMIYEIKKFKFKCLDNIFFSKDIKFKKSGTLTGYSDHRLVWVDLVT